MKTLASVAFGTAALAASTLGFAEPAAARSNVGIYVSPYGIGVAFNPNYCGDYWYRQNHWDYCARYAGYYDNANWPFFGGYYNNYNTRYRNFDRGRHDGWERGDHRGGDRHDGGNRGGDHHHR